MRYIFGHSKSSHRDEFATKATAIEYLQQELPNQRAFRYRTTYMQRNVDRILFSFEGELLAELIVADVQRPSEADLTEYSKTRTVYLIDEINIFANQSLRPRDFDIRSSQFGTSVPDAVYEKIIASAEGFTESIKRPA